MAQGRPSRYGTGMKDVSALVARQYEAFAYPEPFADLEAEIAKGYFQIGDPALYGPVLWPRGRPASPLNILVAGCGTIQAAYTAFLNRKDRVTGVDLSEASLAHERFLQEKHGLDNLTLFQGDLLDIRKLGRQFDVILCSGVLHHLADPDAGLAALRYVLAPEGVMTIMVYAPGIRTGVYMLQDAFRRLGIGQDPAGVAQVRAILAELPERHFAQSYIRAAVELRHDSALVDTFLHPQDRSYTIPQIFDWLEGAGLAFQNWVDNHSYWRNARWGPDSATGKALDALPPREHWAAAELLGPPRGMHIFTARHASASLPTEVDFAAPDWRDFMPHHAPGLGKTGPRRYQRGTLALQCTPAEELVLDGADGFRSIGEIIAHPALSGTPRDRLEAFAREAFERFWKLGHVMIALPRV